MIDWLIDQSLLLLMKPADKFFFLTSDEPLNESEETRLCFVHKLSSSATSRSFVPMKSFSLIGIVEIIDRILLIYKRIDPLLARLSTRSVKGRPVSLCSLGGLLLSRQSDFSQTNVALFWRKSKNLPITSGSMSDSRSLMSGLLKYNSKQCSTRHSSFALPYTSLNNRENFIFSCTCFNSSIWEGERMEDEGKNEWRRWSLMCTASYLLCVFNRRCIHEQEEYLRSDYFTECRLLRCIP